MWTGPHPVAGAGVGSGGGEGGVREAQLERALAAAQVHLEYSMH